MYLSLKAFIYGIDEKYANVILIMMIPCLMISIYIIIYLIKEIYKDCKHETTLRKYQERRQKLIDAITKIKKSK